MSCSRLNDLISMHSLPILVCYLIVYHYWTWFHSFSHVNSVSPYLSALPTDLVCILWLKNPNSTSETSLGAACWSGSTVPFNIILMLQKWRIPLTSCPNTLLLHLHSMKKQYWLIIRGLYQTRVFSNNLSHPGLRETADFPMDRSCQYIMLSESLKRESTTTAVLFLLTEMVDMGDRMTSYR